MKIIIFFLLIYFITLRFAYADDIDLDKDEDINIENVISTSQNIQLPTINSRRYVVYDRNSHRVIYGKNEKVKSAMASTTKIMTATIVLEKSNLDDIVEISDKAAGTGGSRLGLKKKDKISVRDLLYGLMLKSGNDAAVALAEHVGENVEDFAQLMNKKAEELNLKNTHFVTPHGLDNENHFTTAEELAVLTDYALNNETFRKIVGTKEFSITINGYSKTIQNTNELLGVLKGVVGVKTGFTNGAGRCLVTETKRDEKDIIVVVLGADTKKYRTSDSIKLIENTFKNYIEVDLQEKVEENFNNWKMINTKRINVVRGQREYLDQDSLFLEDIKTKKLLINKDDVENLEFNINTIIEIEAPVDKNQTIGILTIKLNGKIIENIKIKYSDKIEKKNISDYLKILLNQQFEVFKEVIKEM